MIGRDDAFHCHPPTQLASLDRPYDLQTFADYSDWKESAKKLPEMLFSIMKPLSDHRVSKEVSSDAVEETTMLAGTPLAISFDGQRKSYLQICVAVIRLGLAACNNEPHHGASQNRSLRIRRLSNEHSSQKRSARNMSRHFWMSTVQNTILADCYRSASQTS